MMSAEGSLRKSIVLLFAALFAVQTAVCAAILVAYSIPLEEAGLFAGINAVYHAAFALILRTRAADFRIEATGEQLPRVNPPNVITLVRLSSIPTALFLILLSRRVQLLPVALPYLLVVFATDFVDGIVARARKEVTVVGRYLDSASDYLILIATSIVFFVFSLIPAWIFILILARLVIFAAFMTAAALKQGRANTATTFLGKASIFAVMTLFLLETAEYFSVPVIGHHIVVRIMEYAAAAVVAASFLDKAVFLRKLFTGRLQGADAPGPEIKAKDR